MTAVSLSDWAAFLFLGVGVHAALSVPYFLLVDADPSDFDPRPAVRRALESGRLDRLLLAVGPAKADAREAVAESWQFARLSVRDAAISLAALHMLLSPTSEAAR